MKLKFLNSCIAVMRYKIRPIPGHVDVFQDHKMLLIFYITIIIVISKQHYLKYVGSHAFPVPIVL